MVGRSLFILAILIASALTLSIAHGQNYPAYAELEHASEHHFHDDESYSGGDADHVMHHNHGCHYHSIYPDNAVSGVPRLAQGSTPYSRGLTNSLASNQVPPDLRPPIG